MGLCFLRSRRGGPNAQRPSRTLRLPASTAKVLGAHIPSASARSWRVSRCDLCAARLLWCSEAPRRISKGNASGRVYRRDPGRVQFHRLTLAVAPDLEAYSREPWVVDLDHTIDETPTNCAHGAPKDDDRVAAHVPISGSKTLAKSMSTSSRLRSRSNHSRQPRSRTPRLSAASRSLSAGVVRGSSARSAAQSQRAT